MQSLALSSASVRLGATWIAMSRRPPSTSFTTIDTSLLALLLCCRRRPAAPSAPHAIAPPSPLAAVVAAADAWDVEIGRFCSRGIFSSHKDDAQAGWHRSDSCLPSSCSPLLSARPASVRRPVGAPSSVAAETVAAPFTPARAAMTCGDGELGAERRAPRTSALSRAIHACRVGADTTLPQIPVQRQERGKLHPSTTTPCECLFGCTILGLPYQTTNPMSVWVHHPWATLSNYQRKRCGHVV